MRLVLIPSFGVSSRVLGSAALFHDTTRAWYQNASPLSETATQLRKVWLHLHDYVLLLYRIFDGARCGRWRVCRRRG